LQHLNHDLLDGFFLELFGVTLLLWHDTPPGALSRFSDVSTISGIDQVVSHDFVAINIGLFYLSPNSLSLRFSPTHSVPSLLET